MTSPPSSKPTNRPGGQPAGTASRYRAVSAVAVVSLVVGLLSVVAVVHWSLLIIPVVGMLLGRTALRRIRRHPDELSGTGLAWAGIGTSLAFALLGIGVVLFVRATAFPYGYQRVEYESLQPDPGVPNEYIPPAAYDYVFDANLGNKVGIEGYMYPSRQTTGLKSFYLCPAIPNCQFCAPDPVPTQIVHVTLEGDLTAHYTNYLIRVGGKFRIDETSPDGSPYFLDADFLAQPRQ